MGGVWELKRGNLAREVSHWSSNLLGRTLREQGYYRVVANELARPSMANVTSVEGVSSRMLTLDESDIAGIIVCHNNPETSGVYVVTDENGSVLYVGSSNCLRRRIAYLEAHVRDKSSGRFTHDASDRLIELQASGNKPMVHYINCEHYRERERELIQKYRPPWNNSRSLMDGSAR